MRKYRILRTAVGIVRIEEPTERQESTPASLTPAERHDEARKQCWISAWSLTASAVTCNKIETATSWADEALKQFDKRFPAPNTQNSNS